MRHMFQARRHRLPMAGNAPVFSMKPILSRIFIALLLLAHAACGDSMLQYFNTSWAEITRKMPELAEAGYQSLWLPPPAKGSGGTVGDLAQNSQLQRTRQMGCDHIGSKQTNHIGKFKSSSHCFCNCRAYRVDYEALSTDIVQRADISWLS